MKAKKTSRHGFRADNKTATSISLRADLLELAKAQAEKEGRTFSNWIEQLLKAKLPESELPPKK